MHVSPEEFQREQSRDASGQPKHGEVDDEDLCNITTATAAATATATATATASASAEYENNNDYNSITQKRQCRRGARGREPLRRRLWRLARSAVYKLLYCHCYCYLFYYY